MLCIDGGWCTGAHRYTVVISQHEKATTLNFTLKALAAMPFKMAKVPSPFQHQKEHRIEGAWSEQVQSNTHADWVCVMCAYGGGNTPPIRAPQETAVPRSCPSIPCLACLANSTLMLPSPFRLLADLPTTVPRMRRTQSGCSGLKQAETSPTSSRFRCGFSCLPPRNTLQALLCDAAPLASRLIRGRTGQCERSNGAPIPANVLEYAGGMMLCPP